MRIDLDKIFAYAEKLGVSELEVVLQENKQLDISGVKDRVESTRYVAEYYLGYRLLYGKKKATYGATITSTGDALRVLEETVKIARISPEDPYWKNLPRRLGPQADAMIYDEHTGKLDPSKAIEIVSSSIDIVKNYDPRVSPVTVKLQVGGSETLFANNYGEETSRKETIVFYMVAATAKENGREGTFYEYRWYRRLGDLDYHELSRRAAKKALDSAHAKQLETMKASVVFEGKIWASILSSLLLPAITADSIQEKRSPLIGKIGSQIAGDEVSVVDDPYIPWYYGSKNIDDEGVRTLRKHVIRKGVLETYLYDHHTASREGRESTGNAYRMQPWSNPRPWATNLVFVEGDASIDEIIRDTRRGILVSETIGQWLSNPVSGQLNATISHGYLIENGEIKHPVKGMIVSAQFYEVLAEKIRVIGKDLECYANTCSPPIRVDDVTLAGR